MNQKCKLVALFLLLFHCSYALADDGNSDSNQTSGISGIAKGLFDFIYGQPVKDGIIYLPAGFDTRAKKKKLLKTHLIALSWRSFIFGTYINSYHDRTWTLALSRNIIDYHGFGVDDSIGAVYGYKGKLSKYGNKPLKNTFLFRRNVSPVLVLDVFYRVSDHLQFQVMSTYLAVLGGIKYNF